MPATEPNDFFREKRSLTEIKKEVLEKYLEIWCKSRIAAAKAEGKEALLYIDLNVGEVQPATGETTLPAEAIEFFYKTILKRPLLNETVHTFLYDKNKAVLEQASQFLDTLPFYQELMHPPVVLNSSEQKASMMELFSAGCPSLVFMNSFSGSYVQEVFQHALNSAHAGLLLLLSPETITKSVAGKKVGQPLVELLGERLQKIQNYCRKEKDKHRQQQFILDHLTDSLQEKDYFTLLFKVNPPDVAQPYHYLLFSSQDSSTYRSFKEMLLPYSTQQEDGIPLFIANEFQQPQLSLFEQRPAYTLANLVERLLDQAPLYKYKSIEKIYELDNCNTNYSRENYIAAFAQLQAQGKIELLNGKTLQTIRQPTPASVVKYRLQNKT